MGRYTNHSAVHTVRMQRIPEMEWEGAANGIQDDVLGVWQSRDFLAIHYRDDRGERLSVNRTAFDRQTGSWRDGIPWDDLQRIKHQCGLGDRWAVELYPPDRDIVNVAAMRHLWLLTEQPAYGWDRENQ